MGDRPVPRDEDKRSGIRSDPNRAADPEYIVRLVGQVIRVSVETVRIVKALPGLERIGNRPSRTTKTVNISSLIC